MGRGEADDTTGAAILYGRLRPQRRAARSAPPLLLSASSQKALTQAQDWLSSGLEANLNSLISGKTETIALKPSLLPPGNSAQEPEVNAEFVRNLLNIVERISKNLLSGQPLEYPASPAALTIAHSLIGYAQACVDDYSEETLEELRSLDNPLLNNPRILDSKGLTLENWFDSLAEDSYSSYS